MNELVPINSANLPALAAAAGERAGMRFLEFFAANIRNPHTRRAYARAADEFLAWCAAAGVASIGSVQPVHVATCASPIHRAPLKRQGRGRDPILDWKSSPSSPLCLNAIRRSC